MLQVRSQKTFWPLVVVPKGYSRLGGRFGVSVYQRLGSVGASAPTPTPKTSIIRNRMKPVLNDLLYLKMLAKLFENFRSPPPTVLIVSPPRRGIATMRFTYT
jgi:hypothetical protein